MPVLRNLKCACVVFFLMYWKNSYHVLRGTNVRIDRQILRTLSRFAWYLNFGYLKSNGGQEEQDIESTKQAVVIEMKSLRVRVSSDFHFNSDRTDLHNVLMSLPTSLIHCILSDWVNVVAIIRLDIALAGSWSLSGPLRTILKSHQFFIHEVRQSTSSNPEYTFSGMFDWLTSRKVKVTSLEPHEQCRIEALSSYLTTFGMHVQHAHPNNKFCQSWADRYLPTQSVLFGKYCSQLSSYTNEDTSYAHDDSIRRTLCNNPGLEKLDMYGGMWGCNNIFNVDTAFTLHNLKRLKWGDKCGLDGTLVALAKKAPNLQQLSIYSHPGMCTVVEGALMLEVSQACPHLRTLCCKELHIGPEDSFLKPFLAACTDVVHLNLHNHVDLTDDVLIMALTELKCLHSLDLRGCYQLTDRTLVFLAQRFRGTLQVIYLDYSVSLNYEVDENRDLVVTAGISKGYTAAGIATLRAQCTQLHTFHYAIEVGTPAQPLNIEAFQNATIVNVGCMGDEVVPLILEHCHQMDILVMLDDRYQCNRAWLSSDELMTIVARFPQLRVVVNERRKDEVDYSAVMKAFPKLVFTENMEVANFDVFSMLV